MNITDHLQEDKYVAFLDVLGFKELVKNKGDKLNIYFSTIQSALEDINQDKPLIESQLISDSTILACSLNNDDFRSLLKAVQTIQSRCALKNIWIRGAITIGDIYFNQSPNIVVGTGLTNAYLLEAEEEFPRVIIDPKVIKRSFNTREDFISEFNTSNQKHNRVPLIHEIRNEQLYIANDAFFVAFVERLAIESFDNLEIIYQHLKDELYSGQQNYKKYFWLKNYFREALFQLEQYYFAIKFSDEEKYEIRNTIQEWQFKYQIL